ncbi:MAG: hypothetical protein M1829_006746 [Trizodia sp. TS-e1964]|nr:MAG: hypothetical protein M1829_006746 [Trizodia sp. TS-e1964]
MQLVSRLARIHPQYLQSPDPTEKGNTSLHMAAKLGHAEIAQILLDAGHECCGVSRNVVHDTPLMLAAEDGHLAVVQLLVTRFPAHLLCRNAAGLDALAHAAKAGHNAVVSFFLASGAFVNAQDNEGNTALHYASAHGHLKVVRTLLAAGADPLLRNHFAWTPMAYSATAQAEVYFKGLIDEIESIRREVLGGVVAAERVEVPRAERAERTERGLDRMERAERKQKAGGGIRLVTQVGGVNSPGTVPHSAIPHSTISHSVIPHPALPHSAVGHHRQDEWLPSPASARKMWAGIERPGTPTSSGPVPSGLGGRGRAGSGD